MTLTYAGFDVASGKAIETEGQWSLLNYRAGKLGNTEGVLTSGDLITSVAGARRFSVAAFAGLLPGILVDNDAPLQTPLHDAQTTGSRIDYLCLTADWSANTVAFEVVKGASATLPPSLGTQTIGALYRMPFARVKVNAGATQFVVGTDVERAYPTPRFPVRGSAPVNLDSMRGNATSWNTLGNIVLPDPGWPYRLLITARARINANETGGYMNIRALDPDTTTVYGNGVTDWLALAGYREGGKSVAEFTESPAAIFTGPRRVRLEMLPASAGAADVLQVLDHPTNTFTVLQIPAG